MNAAATVKAAIEKLEELKAGKTPGRWSYYFEPWGDVMSEQEPGLGVETVVAAEMSAHDGTLVVTLHRTIDAQLAILRCYIGTAEYWDKVRGTPDDLLAVLDLARAILGES